MLKYKIMNYFPFIGAFLVLGTPSFAGDYLYQSCKFEMKIIHFDGKTSKLLFENKEKRGTGIFKYNSQKNELISSSAPSDIMQAINKNGKIILLKFSRNFD